MFLPEVLQIKQKFYRILLHKVQFSFQLSSGLPVALRTRHLRLLRAGNKLYLCAIVSAWQFELHGVAELTKGAAVVLYCISLTNWQFWLKSFTGCAIEWLSVLRTDLTTDNICSALTANRIVPSLSFDPRNKSHLPSNPSCLLVIRPKTDFGRVVHLRLARDKFHPDRKLMSVISICVLLFCVSALGFIDIALIFSSLPFYSRITGSNLSQKKHQIPRQK